MDNSSQSSAGSKMFTNYLLVIKNFIPLIVPDHQMLSERFTKNYIDFVALVLIEILNCGTYYKQFHVFYN